MRRMLIVIAALILGIVAGIPEAEAARGGYGRSYSAHTISRATTIKSNRHAGKRREAQTVQMLKQRHPKAKIQNESMLRTAEGKKARDPLTGKGRRIDHAVIEKGKVVKTVETTSLTADKVRQSARE